MGERAATAGRHHAGPAVRCPRCHLVLAPRVPVLTPRYCPRCLVRRRVTVELEAQVDRQVDRPAPDSGAIALTSRRSDRRL